MSAQADIKVASINPDDVHAYLTRHGWGKIGTSYNKAMDVYAHTTDENEIVHVPTSPHYVDYALRIQELAQAVGYVEDRPRSAILRDLSSAGMDRVQVRLPQAFEDHSIPLHKGKILLVEAVKLLTAAAHAVSLPKQRATQCVQAVRLGQTEPGSFVVNLLVPILPSPTEQEPLIELEPPTRLMTQKLATGLQASREAMGLVSHEDKIAAFKEGISRGVTANLCQSVATLIETGNGLDVSVRWALTQKVPDGQEGERFKATFSPDDTVILNEAATVLKGKQKNHPHGHEHIKDIKGYIAKLDRDEDQPDGRVTIKTSIQGKSCSVMTTFSESDYSRVTEAHDKRQTVSLEGDLHREGQQLYLEDPRKLVVNDDEDQERLVDLIPPSG